MFGPPVQGEDLGAGHRPALSLLNRQLSKSASKGSKQQLLESPTSPCPPGKGSTGSGSSLKLPWNLGKRGALLVFLLAVVSVSTIFFVRDLRFSGVTSQTEDKPSMPSSSIIKEMQWSTDNQQQREQAQQLQRVQQIQEIQPLPLQDEPRGQEATLSMMLKEADNIEEAKIAKKSKKVKAIRPPPGMEVPTDIRSADRQIQEVYREIKKARSKNRVKKVKKLTKQLQWLQSEKDRLNRMPSPPPPPPSPPPCFNDNPYNPLDPPLGYGHPCANFTIPPPPSDKKRSGPRPCPVCYLPQMHAIASVPPKNHLASHEPVLKHLTYVTEEDLCEKAARKGGSRPSFAGHQSLRQREDSFVVQESMRVHCGFVWGGKPMSSTGFDVSDTDRRYMERCTGIVVGSAIFGAYDVVQQPVDISEQAKREVCFVMFVDETTFNEFERDGTLKYPRTRRVGLWRLIVVRNLPYGDPRRTGKIPKLLAHRLFPNSQFSMWVDAKLQLVQDPYKILERFLWRGNFSWAISRHYKRFDVFVEAEANKAAGKYNNASIDAQMEVYRNDGMTPFTEAKLPIISDVPEGCVILREHTPVSNLMACLWFNEVHRFTSRDQLSFGYTRDKIQRSVPSWKVNMFLDCQRRNFVVQGYHKAILTQKIKEHQVPPPPPPTPEEGGMPEELEELRREEEMLGLASSSPSSSTPLKATDEAVEDHSSENERQGEGEEGVFRSSSSSSNSGRADRARSGEDIGDQTRSPVVFRGGISSISDRQSTRLVILANTAEESAQ